MGASSSQKTPAQWRQHVLALSVPIMLSNVTVPLVGIVDTAVMGRMESPAYLAATAIGAVIFSTLFWVFGFLKMGISGLVAQSLGAGNLEPARRTTMRALLLAGFFSSLLLLFKTPLMNAGIWSMKVEPEVQQLAIRYFEIRIWAAPAVLVQYAIVGTLIGLQRMRLVFLLQLVLNIGNVILTLVFFNYTQMNISGVALATVISEYMTAIIGLVFLWPYLCGQEQQDQPHRHSWLPVWLLDRERMIELFNIGANIFIRSLCLTAAYYWMTMIGSRQGMTLLAVNTVLLQMAHLMAHALDGFAHAAETLSGHAYGARNRRALSESIKASTFWALIVAMLFTLLFAVAGQPLFNLMTTQSAVRNAAAAFLPWIVLSPLVCVASFLLDGIFIGTTHTREMRNGMIISLLVFVMATQLLTPSLHNHGLWASYYLLMISRAVTLAWWYPRIPAALS